MAFINEFISPEDFQKYDVEGVCKKTVGRMWIAPPFGWTIDRTRNIFLLHVDSGSYDEFTHFTFLLWFDGSPIITVLEKMEGSYADQSGGKAIWRQLKMQCPEEAPAHHAEIIRVLKEAMITYGFNGAFGQIKNYHVEFNF
jgi:hypothetical protein